MKKSYQKPEIAELNAGQTQANKQTPSMVEGVNPGGNQDPMFGDAALS
jgi:hypothetical protein